MINNALQKFAAAIICVHNHPSGNIAPSPEDKKITGELSAAGKTHGNHGAGSYHHRRRQLFYSFADEGIMG